MNKALKEETILLEEGRLTKENLIRLIKTNCVREGVKHRLISLMKYNFTIDPRDVIDFIKSDDCDGSKYLSSEQYLSDIRFEDTVCIFQDINALFFLFYEGEPRKKSSTKKIYMKSQQRKTRRRR